jgi:hypothetical protein
VLTSGARRAQRADLPVRKLPSDSPSWYWSTALGEVPVAIMLCSMARPAADSGLSMMTLDGFSGSRMLLPAPQIYSQPLQTSAGT